MSTQFLRLPNGQISYEDLGAGPLVVCLPSLGDLRAEYRFLAPRLVSAGYRVIQMDLRGLGQSSPRWDDYSVAAVGADLLALLSALDAGPAAVLGTSMSAGAAVWAAVENPSAFSALVLIGPAVHGDVSAVNRLLYSTLFSRPWGPSVWVKYYKTLYPTQPPSDLTDYTADLTANLREPGRIEAVLASMLASKAASADRLSQVTLPVQIIMGSRDPDFKQPEVEARWLAEQVHGAYHLIPEAGHYPHAEMPAITAPLILDFLSQHQPAGELLHVA